MSREYWFIPDETYVYLPALIMGKAPSSGIANMNMIGEDAEPIAGKVVSVEIDDCIKIEDPSILSDAPDDYIALASVNEAAILYNARKRFFEKKIYTSCGAVLMSVNPFERIPNLYGEEVMAQYRNALADDLNAHVYLIPSRAYHSMCAFGRNQSLLISGESGAGKTEATKQCLSFLAAIAGTSVTQSSTPKTGQRGRRKSKLVGSSSEAIDISNRIIAASPILESFGNAQTLRNPNSSRFGKWMELGFDEQGRITGSKITSYLLEKSRVTKVGKGERSYHIFYQLLRGNIDYLEDKSTVAYRYLNSHGLNEEAPDFEDSTNHGLMMTAFADMGFVDREIQEILKCVCAVLILGNVSFKDEHDGEASSVGVEGAKAAQKAAGLISVPLEELNMALTTKSMTTGARKSIVVQRLNVDKAADTRDSLARALFDRTFTHIISRMNENNEEEKQSVSSIGLLDIFGFEIFKENSFEQLCINYCNEMLQNHFNFVIFTAEKQLYAEENIFCDTIEFRDNQAVINDIQTAFVNLDEEAKIPKGNSKTWFDKMVKNCPSVGARGGAGAAGGAAKKFSKFVIPAHKNSFVVAHYAGDVSYLPAMFLEKNTERLSDSLLQLMGSSSSSVMKSLFEKKEEQESGRAQKTVKSISWNFTNQLNSLMTMLRQSDSHFIRCIKSNDACKPMVFDAELVQRQLLYSGVFEVIKIQQSGLPFRLAHQDFQRRYCCLFPVALRWSFGTVKAFVEGMKSSLSLDLPTIQIGKTRVFYKGSEHRLFEVRREKILRENSIRLQRWMLMQTCRCAYKRHNRQATKFAAALRDVDVVAARSAFNEVTSSTLRLAMMSNFDESLKHVRERVDRAMTTLQLQQDLLKKLKEVLPNRTVAGLNEVDELLKKAESIGMPDHHLVREGLKVLKDFKNAQAAAKMVREHSSFKSLSRDDLDNRIACIDEFKDLLADAPELLEELRKHRDAFEREMKTVLPALNDAIDVESVVMNQSGDLVPAKGPGAAGKKALEVIADINEAELVSADCLTLIRDIRFYLRVRDQVIPSGRHRELLDLLSGEEAGAITHPALSSQLMLFKEYGYLHLTGALLEEALQRDEEGVPGTYTDLEGATTEEKKAKALPTDRFGTVLEYISVLKSPSKELLARREVANTMAQLRQAYSLRQWDLLDDTLRKADAMWGAFAKESPPKYVSAKKELDNCRWQSRHRACLVRLTELSMETPFMDTPVSSDDWGPLLAAPATVAKINAGLADAEAFAKPHLSQPMTDLHGVTQLMVQLRQAVSLGVPGLAQARAHMDTLQKNNETGALPSEVKSVVRSELSSCEQFVSLLRYERDLEKSLKGEGDFNATMLSDATFFMGISDPVQQAAITAHVVDLTKALEMLGNMAELLPSKLSRKVMVARELLFGKKMLLKPSFTTTQEVTAFSGSAGPASMFSFNTWSSALKRLSAFEMNETADDAHLVDEMAFIREELARRKFYSGFLGVALDVSLSGAVGRLRVHLGSMPQLFKTLSSAFSKADIGLPVLLRLRTFVEHLLRLLELVSGKQWVQAKDEMALCESYKPDENLGASEPSTESEAAKDELYDTLFFARNEVEFYVTLAAMRDGLEGLSVRFLDDGAIDRASIDMTSLQSVHDALSRFRSKVPEALDLLSAAKDVISVLLPLSPSASADQANAAPVTAQFVLALREQLDRLSLPSEGVIAVTDMIMVDREVDRLHELIVGAGTSRDDCRALQMELQAALRQPLVPDEILAWIRAAQGYCSMLLARADGDALAQHQLALAVNEAGAALKARNEKGFALKALLAKTASAERTNADFSKLLIGRGKGTLDPKRKLSTQQNAHIRPTINDRQRRRLSSYAGADIGGVGATPLVAHKQAAAAAMVDLVPTDTELSDTAVTQRRLQAVQMLLHNDRNVNVRDEALAGASMFKSLFDEAVRVAQLLPFRWNDSLRRLEIVRDANQQQVEVMSRFLEVYPSAQEDISVVQVLFSYHRVVGCLELGSSLNSRDFEPALQEFMKVADVELVFADLRSSVGEATALLRRMDIVLRVTEHCKDALALFRGPCYDRAEWDELANSRSFILDKAATEPDNVITAETKNLLRCFSEAHRMCIALALKLEDRFKARTTGMEETLAKMRSPALLEAVRVWLEGVPSLRKEQGPRLAPPDVRIKAYDAKLWDDQVVAARVVDSSARSELFLLRLADAVSNWEGQLREYLFEFALQDTEQAQTATAMLEAAPPMHQVNDLPYNFDLPAFQELHAWVQQAFRDHDVAVPESDRISLGPVSWSGGQLLDLPDPTELSQLLGPSVDAAQVSQVGSLIMEKVTALLEGGAVDPYSQRALLRILHEVHVHCEKVASWWVPLDMRHFSPFSLSWASESASLLPSTSEGQGGDDDQEDALREKVILSTFSSIRERPANEDTGDPDRSEYVDEVLLGTRVEAQVRRLASADSWSHWMRPLAMLACSLNIELHRLSIWRDIDMAAREIADLMQDTLAYSDTAPPLYSSADTAPTVQERCLENRHRTYLMQSMMRRAYNRAVCTEVGAGEDMDEDVDEHGGTPELPHSPLSTEYSIYLEYGSLLGAVFSLGRVGTLGALARGVGVLASLQEELLHQHKTSDAAGEEAGGGIIGSTVPVVQRGMWAYSERVSMFTSAEAVVANRGSILPPSESSLKEGVDEMSLSEQLARALTRVRETPLEGTDDQTERRQGEAVARVLALVEHMDLPSGVVHEVLQELVLARSASKTRSLEAALAGVEASLPEMVVSQDSTKRTVIDLDRLLGVFEPFIAYLEEQSHLKHVNATRLMDLDNRAALIACYRACLDPTPGAAPALCHLETTLMSLGRLRRPSLRLLGRLIYTVLSTRDLFVHFVAAMQVTHGEVLHLDVDRYVNLSPALRDILEEDDAHLDALSRLESDLTQELHSGHVKGLGRLLHPLRRASTALHTLLRRYQTALWQQAEGRVDEALEEVEAMLDDIEQMRSSTGDLNVERLPAACFDLPSILTALTKIDRDLHAKRHELVTQHFIHSVKAALKPCAIVAPLPEGLDTMDVQFPFPTTYTHLGHSSSRSLGADTRALRDALRLEESLWHERQERRVNLSAEDTDVVARAKIILRLRETMYEHPSSLEEEKNALVAKVDEIVRDWHSGSIVAPDAGMGSDEARASRALVFFDYLSRAIQEAPDRADSRAVASILHASVRHTGYEKSVGVELYLEQASAMLDLLLARDGQHPWALPLVPPPDDDTTDGPDSMVTRRLRFSLHSRQLSESMTRRRSKVQHLARQQLLLMELMKHYCPIVYGPSLRLKARAASPYVGTASSPGSGSPGGWDSTAGPLQAKSAPFQVTDRSFVQLLANLKKVLSHYEVPTRYVDGRGKDQFEEGEWGSLYDWDGDLSEEELERRAGEAVLPYSQAQFAALVNAWDSLDSFSALSHAPGLMYPLAVLRARLAMYRRRAIAEWDRARSARRVRPSSFPSPSSFFELSYPLTGEGNITPELITAAAGEKETRNPGPGRSLAAAMASNKYKKLLDSVVGPLDTLRPPLDNFEADQELDGYTPCASDDLSAGLDPHTRGLRALAHTAKSVRGTMLPPPGGTSCLEWRHTRQALKIMHQSHASNHLDEDLYLPKKSEEGHEEDKEDATTTGAAPAAMWAARPEQTAALLSLFQEMDNLPPLLECESRLFIDEQVARSYVDLYVCFQTLRGLTPEGDDPSACCPSRLCSTVETLLHLQLSIVQDDAQALQELADQFYAVVDSEEHPEDTYMKWASLQNWFELSTAINMHNKVIECMLFELNPAETNLERRRRERKVGRILAEQTGAPVGLDEVADTDADAGGEEEGRVSSNSKEGVDKEDPDEGTDEVFFTFVNVSNLRTLVIDSDECALQSHELHDLTAVSRFVLSVIAAIDQGLWLEHEETRAQGRGKCIQGLLVELEGLPSPPRAVAHELQMLAKVCENKHFEHKLLLALRSNHEYLDDSLSRHADVEVGTLRSCLEATSKLRHRGKRNMALFACATLVLELRTAVKFADWEEIRRVLRHFDPRLIVPADVAELAREEDVLHGMDVQRMRSAASEEALLEIDTMQALSDQNALMHDEVLRAFRKSKVGGVSFMRLDCQKLSVQELIRVSHTYAKTARISQEDKMLWYSLEKLSSLRSSLITNDHAALLEKMKSVKVARVHQGCVEEVVFIKKAVEFSQIIGRVREHLDSTSLSGHAGSRFVEDVNILHLEKMLLILNPEVCPPSSKAFLLGATTVLKLRHAIKAMRWDVVEATKCVLAHHNVETAGSVSSCTHEPRRVRYIEILKEIFGHTQRSHDGRPLSEDSRRGSTSMEEVEGHVRRHSTVLFASTNEDGTPASGTGESREAEALRPSDARRASQAAAGGDGAFDTGKSDVIATYRDRPGSMIHVSSVFAHSSLDPHGVPALLYSLTQTGVLKEAETEVTMMRDELYHRVTCSLLRMALSSEETVEAEVLPQDQGQDGDRGIMPSNVALDNAIAACRHLGIRSEESHRLFQTALFMRAVRMSYEKGDIEKTMTLLGLIEGLKRNNRFDVVATAEVESIFRNICSATIISELSEVLEQGLLDNGSVDNEMRLKKSLRKANTVDALTDEAVKVLSICDVIVALQAAIRSCVLGRIELNLRRSERIASSIHVASAATSTAFARLAEVQRAARTCLEEEQLREAQREIDLVTNAPSELDRSMESSAHGAGESKEAPGMKLSIAPLVGDGERETEEHREAARKLHSAWLAPRQTEADSSQLPVACHTLAGALARAINSSGDDGKIVVHRGGVFQDLLEGVLSIKQGNLWSRASTPVEVGSVSTALMLCTLLLAPLTYHPVTLMSRDADTPAKKMMLIKRRKEQSMSEIVFDVKLLSLARGVIESVAQQQEERNLEIELKQAKAFVAAEEQQERVKMRILMQGEGYNPGDEDSGSDVEEDDREEGTGEGKRGEGATGTINDLVDEDQPPVRIKKGPVGAAVVNNAFLQLGEFLSLFMESHLTDKFIRLYAVNKLKEMKDTRKAKNLVGLDYIVGVLEAGTVEAKSNESSVFAGFGFQQAVKSQKFSYI